MLTSLTKAACMEGISLTYEWSTKPFIVEIDSQVAANMIKQLEIDQSPTASITGKSIVYSRGVDIFVLVMCAMHVIALHIV